MKKNNPLINILIRTSGRPRYFEQCIRSIKNQIYKNYKIHITYDNKTDYEYIENHIGSNDSLIFQNKIDRTKKINFPYNLYINKLYKNINSGWIIFLDDDNKLVSKHSLTIISKYLTDNNNLVIWKVKLFDKIIPLNSFNIKPTLYDIDSSNFTFHSQFKDKYGLWDGNKCADFRVIEALYQNLPRTVWIDEIIAESQREHIYGGKGQRDDFNHRISLYSKIYIRLKIIIWKLFKRN